MNIFFFKKKKKKYLKVYLNKILKHILIDRFIKIVL